MIQPAEPTKSDLKEFSDPGKFPGRVEYTPRGRWLRWAGDEGRTYYREYESRARFAGMPLVHFTAGTHPTTGKSRAAIGWIAIGQYAYGGLAIGQFAVGLVSVGQFSLSLLAGVGQFTTGMIAIGQVAVGGLIGVGQLASESSPSANSQSDGRLSAPCRLAWDRRPRRRPGPRLPFRRPPWRIRLQESRPPDRLDSDGSCAPELGMPTSPAGFASASLSARWARSVTSATCNSPR